MKPFLLNILPVLLLIGAAQGLFFAIVLARLNKGNRSANKILSGILILFSVDLVEGFLSATYALTRVPCLIGLNWPLVFSYGPLLYFYVRMMTDDSGNNRPHGKFIAHFLPTLLLYLYLLPFYLADPDWKVRAWVSENGALKNHTPLVDPILYVAILQIAGYLMLSLRLLGFHAENVQQRFSSVETVNLAWLRNLIFTFIGLLCLYAFHSVSSQFFGIYQEAGFLLNLSIAGLIYVFAYKGIRQPEVFTAENRLPMWELPAFDALFPDQPYEEVSEDNPRKGNDRAEKYRKSALTEEQAEAILSRVRDVMERDKPYREMGLTLPLLARVLDVSPHHLSQTINGRLDRSFFDFVNAYRVEDAKRAMSAPDAGRFSILGIAMDAGFNSKTAFYTAFKKHTGMTPSRFKELANRPEGAPLADSS